MVEGEIAGPFSTREMCQLLDNVQNKSSWIKPLQRVRMLFKWKWFDEHVVSFSLQPQFEAKQIISALSEMRALSARPVQGTHR